jgi:hypothetical protein
VHPEKEVYLGPFTDDEVRLYITKNCPGETYTEKTTLPLVIQRVLFNGELYQAVVVDLAYYIMDKLLDSLQSTGKSDTLKLLYSYFHLSNSMHMADLLRLRNCGLVYCRSPELRSEDLELVFERRIIFNLLLHTAAENVALFSRYDIGGAHELLFSDCCRRGEIRATCLGASFATRSVS